MTKPEYQMDMVHIQSAEAVNQSMASRVESGWTLHSTSTVNNYYRHDAGFTETMPVLVMVWQRD